MFSRCEQYSRLYLAVWSNARTMFTVFPSGVVSRTVFSSMILCSLRMSYATDSSITSPSAVL